MDADLQHPPELIRDFRSTSARRLPIVYGRRLDRATDSFLHRWAARAFYVAFQRLRGTKLPEGAGDFRLLDRKAIDAMNGMSERVRFNKGLFAWMRFRSIGVPFNVPPRHGTGGSVAAAPLLASASTASPRSRRSRWRGGHTSGCRCRSSRSSYAVVFLLKTLLF